MLKPNITTFFDLVTSTYSYVMHNPSSRTCTVVDPMLDHDPAVGRTSHTSAERLIAYVRQHDLRMKWLLETRVHTDHLSAAISLQRRLSGCLAIDARITQVQARFSGLFNLGETSPVDGHQFEHLFEDGESLHIDVLECRMLHTPGHTPACMTYLAGDSAFVGDTPFVPDYGTARYDFPSGDACQLYRLIQRLLALPGAIRLFMCHDYTVPGRDEHRCETSVGEQRRRNVHTCEGIDEEALAAMRQQRDTTLNMPTLMLPAIQVNMRGGNLPPVEGNGARYLKISPDLF